jgi:hypothetical protein
VAGEGAAPVVVTGGRAPALAPEQAKESPPSFARRQTARPDPSARSAPAAPDFVAITRPEPAAMAAGLAVRGVRIPTDTLIVTVSRLLARATFCRHSPYGHSGAAA